MYRSVCRPFRQTQWSHSCIRKRLAMRLWYYRTSNGQPFCGDCDHLEPVEHGQTRAFNDATVRHLRRKQDLSPTAVQKSDARLVAPLA